MKYITFIVFAGLSQAVAFADSIPYCSTSDVDPNPHYDCKIGEKCECMIHAKSQGDPSLGRISFRFTAIEQKKYQCTFTMSPLSFTVDLNNAYFPTGVTHDELTYQHGAAKLNINATAIDKSSQAPYIMIPFSFGAYDAPSILSSECLEEER